MSEDTLADSNTLVHCDSVESLYQFYHSCFYTSFIKETVCKFKSVRVVRSSTGITVSSDNSFVSVFYDFERDRTLVSRKGIAIEALPPTFSLEDYKGSPKETTIRTIINSENHLQKRTTVAANSQGCLQTTANTPKPSLEEIFLERLENMKRIRECRKANHE